ncbi:MAG TPA: hypothetical protein VKJ45_15805 [Blastocatellia bacterium]|nr:hypothetical protein [Blastocatellia bacterium]
MIGLLINTRIRLATVLMMTLIVGLGPMARSLAESGGDDPPRRAASAPGAEKADYSDSGVLTASGNVTVNDNSAPTGTTVLSGSSVATGGDGIASIDLGKKGLIEMKIDTRILLTLPPELINVELENCGILTQSVPDDLRAHVKVVHPHTLRIYVTVGSVLVRFGEGKAATTISQFEEKSLDNVSEINALGNAVFTIDCSRRPAGLWWVPTSLAGLAALAAKTTLTRDKPKSPNPVPTPPPSTALSPQ